MHTLKILVAASTLIGSLMLAAGAAQAADAAQAVCSPQLLNTRTDFPTKAQLQGEHGVVRVRLALDASGHATAVQVARSSGFATLDRAALNSVREYWRFSVANCSAQELAAHRTVDVTFNSAPRHTLAGTIDFKAIAQTKALAANDQCHQSRDESGDPVFACVKGTTGSYASNIDKSAERLRKE